MIKNNKGIFQLGVLVLIASALASFLIIRNLNLSSSKAVRCIDLGSPKARQACEAGSTSTNGTSNTSCTCPGGTGTSCSNCNTGDIVGGSGQIYCATCNYGSATICAAGYVPNSSHTSCTPMTGVANNNNPSEPTPVPTPVPTPIVTPSPTPSHSPVPTPVCTPTPRPSHSPRPTRSPSPTPTVTSTPSPTPNITSKLILCKYDDKNNNGQIDNGEGTIGWNFIYRYQGRERKINSGWWRFNGGCVTVEVPANQWINVAEEGRGRWNLTGIYQDGNWVGTSDYNYIASADQTKEVKFLNYYSPDSTPSPSPSSTPNWCNGTCGSNNNCQGGYFCYNGYCRNPNCSSDTSCGCGIVATPTPKAPPVVLGATAPPVLPKTGSNDVEIVVGLLSVMATGVFFFRKFKLI